MRHKNVIWVFLFVLSTFLAALAGVGPSEAAVEWETPLDYDYTTASSASSFQTTSDGGLAIAGRRATASR